MVEGTDHPSTASSPDAKVRGILAAGLEKVKIQNQNQQIEAESTRLKSTSHLLVAGGLRGAATLPHHRSRTLRMPSLGFHARSGTVISVILLSNRLFTCTPKVRH
jgi:hypothetical protein